MRTIKAAIILVVATTMSACMMMAQKTEDKRPEQLPQVTAANEMAAISRLRSIATAEMAYMMESATEYATLGELIEKGLIGDPNDGKLANYKFDIKVKSGGFEATAVPLRYGVSGKRSFIVDETRIVRGADHKGDPADTSDPQV